MDKLEIHELLGRYYHFVDVQDKAAWLGLWTDNGHLQNGDHIARGKAELEAFANEHITDPKKHTRHMATNIAVTLNGDRATAVNYMLVMDSTVQGAPHATAICRSELAKAGGEWKLVSHVFETDPSFDFSKVS